MGKIIKIFLASSEELDYDRMVFGNLVRRLDDMYEKRGIRIKLFEWEDYDAAFSDRRKQDEYNDYVRQSDIFLALFHKKAGKFTLEEFDVASEEFKNHASPKVYAFCKDLQPGDVESLELAEFKKRFFDEMKQYWCRYDSRESLQLQFVMQLQWVENRQLDDFKVENGEVTFNGLRIAAMDKLKFATANEDYVKMQTELHELHNEIKMIQLDLEEKQQKLEKKKEKLDRNPENEDYREDFQDVRKEVDKLINNLHLKRIKYNKLKEDFDECQKLVFNTAKRIAQLQGERITERMRRAMDAFNEGKVREANIILDEVEEDARMILEDYKRSKEITELIRQTTISSIEELLLKTSTVMTDPRIPSIKERIERTKNIYAQAEEMAEETNYDKEKYSRLLFDYATFLYDYAFYEEALEIIQKQIALTSDKPKLYNLLGKILYRLDRYQEALDVLNKALDILMGDDPSDESMIAMTYNNIGCVLNRIGDYDKAIEQAQKALNASGDGEKEKMSNSAKSFENIAEGLWSQGSSMKALENYEKALDIERRLFGEDSTEVAITYRHIGDAYRGLSDNNNALKNYNLALSIIEKRFGVRHPEIALTFGCMGVSYMELHKYKEALDYTQKGLEIREEIFGKDNTNTAESYYWLGEIYSSSEFQNYDSAIRYYNKAKDIRTKKYGESHEETLNVEYSIANIYISQGNNSKAIELFQKYVESLEVQNDIKPRIIVSAYYHLGMIYVSSEKYNDAINYLEKSLTISCVEDYTAGSIHVYLASVYKIIHELFKSIGHCTEALTILKRINGEKDSDIARLYSLIGSLYDEDEIKDYDHAMDYYKLALQIQRSSIDTEDFGTAGILYNIGIVQNKLENYSEALTYYNKALEWVSEHEINDISIAEIYNGIGLVYYNQGGYSHALENFLKAEEAKDGLSDIATLYCNIGNAYYALGNFTLALNYFLKELAIREKGLGQTHPDVVFLYGEIGMLYCQMEKYPETRNFLEKMLSALKVHEQSPKSNESSIVMEYETIGSLYYNLGDYSNAVYYYFKCMEMREKIYGVSNVETARSYMNYGAACFNRDNYGTALEYFNKAFYIFQEKLGATNSETQDAQAWIDAVKASIDKNDYI